MDHPKTMQGETMTTAQAVAAIERIIVAAGQSDFSRETIANARAGLDALLSELQTMRQSKEHESERAQSLLHHGVTLATLCVMVLGADAADRSDDALVRAVGEMKREREESIDALREMIGQMEHEADTQHAAALDLQAQRDAAQEKLAEYEGENKRWHSFETVQAIVKERDAVIADARRLAHIAKNVHLVSESENNLIEKYVK